jgi:hypothetical protein
MLALEIRHIMAIVGFSKKSTTYKQFSTYPTKETLRVLLHMTTTKSRSIYVAYPRVAS